MSSIDALAALTERDPSEFYANSLKAGFTPKQALQFTNELLVDPPKLAARFESWSKPGKHQPSPVDNAPGSDVAARLYQRDGFLHQTAAAPAPPLPRLNADELAGRDNERYRRRALPFILTGAMDGWGALSRWKSADYFASLQAKSKAWKALRSEFYPHNMLDMASKGNPLPLSLGEAATQLASRPGDPDDILASLPRVEGAPEGRYFHIPLNATHFKVLEHLGDIPASRHPLLKGDEWMDGCMAKSERDEYLSRTHWQVVLIGSRGAGMFNHTDALQTASWHAHMAGRKWWYVCKHGECYEGILEPGEVLSYGHGWAHLTQNLETPTIAITGTVVTEENYKHVAQRWRGDCVAEALGLHFSAALCDALERCHHDWRKATRASTKPWRPWRQAVVSPKVLARKLEIHAKTHLGKYDVLQRDAGRDEL